MKVHVCPNLSNPVDLFSPEITYLPTFEVLNPRKSVVELNSSTKLGESQKYDPTDSTLEDGWKLLEVGREHL